MYIFRVACLRSVHSLTPKCPYTVVDHVIIKHQWNRTARLYDVQEMISHFQLVTFSEILCRSVISSCNSQSHGLIKSYLFIYSFISSSKANVMHGRFGVSSRSIVLYDLLWTLKITQIWLDHVTGYNDHNPIQNFTNISRSFPVEYG